MAAAATQTLSPTKEWYAAYLEGAHWQRTRTEKIDEVGYRCERCREYAHRTLDGTWGILHVHHLTYERVGHELMVDLEVLCPTCHTVEHGLGEDTEEARGKIRDFHSRRIANATTVDPDWDEIATEINAWDRLLEQTGL